VGVRDEEELDEHVARHELALARDHKKLAELAYTISTTILVRAALWLPNGTVVRDELELRKSWSFAPGTNVSTPHLAKAELYYRTGHLPATDKMSGDGSEGTSRRGEVREAWCCADELPASPVYAVRPQHRDCRCGWPNTDRCTVGTLAPSGPRCARHV
jgi:hypothetical protein